ncbi:MAG: hypothetical protein ABIB71_06405 [Candidatus Woesearchaeota archaeon]
MVAIHLNKQIDDIFSGYSKLETPEERKGHKVEGSLWFKGFEELMRNYERILRLGPWMDTKEAYFRINAVLEPEQINSFLQATIRYEDHENYSNYKGLFFTRLIQNSHDLGNNRFTLDTRAFTQKINALGQLLHGRGNNLLEINVEGSVGDFCGYGAKNIRTLHIDGEVGDHCGFGADNSTFKTPNQQTLQLLKKNVENDRGNRIYFINEDGSEKEIKEW